MALVRERERFLRYVFSVQYNGTPFLGFSYQGPQGENCITKTGVDLRGLFSIEGKIRRALDSLVNGRNKTNMSCRDDTIICCDDDDDKLLESNFENFQVSSRTDRGVHAWKNTFHVDIRSNHPSKQSWETHKLLKGLNYYLKRDYQYLQEYSASESTKFKLHGINNNKKMNKSSIQHPPILTGNEIRILSCKAAPLELIENKHYDPDLILDHSNDEKFDNTMCQPSHISWNARFTALRRTYVYRILSHSILEPNNTDIDLMEEFGVPFEDNWSWRVLHHDLELNIPEMTRAVEVLKGTHDFSSFRGKNCSRSSPIVTIENLSIDVHPLHPNMIGFYKHSQNSAIDITNAKIITIMIQGDAFLYRQVRNIVGCLIEVGKNQLSSEDVRGILLARDRSKAGVMAPAHGLFLANVEHHNLLI